MKHDSIIDEVHQIRQSIARRFNNDLSAICADARKRQAASGSAPLALPQRRSSVPSQRKKAG